MRLFACASILAVLSFGAAKAEPSLTDTGAFERANVASYYNLDACGDSLDGRLYRRALQERFLNCPFTDESRAHYARWSQAEFRHSRELMAKVIDDNGGLPERLPGRSQTCHEQLDTPAAAHLRESLQKYAGGQISAATVLPAACDASSVDP